MLGRRRGALGAWRRALARGAVAGRALTGGAIARCTVPWSVRPIDPSATDAIDDAAGYVAATLDGSAVDRSSISRSAIDRSPIEALATRRWGIATADDTAAPAVRAVGNGIAIIAGRLGWSLWR